MQRSEDRILTSHVGALHTPPDVMAAMVAEWKGETQNQAAVDAALKSAVADVVRRQRDIGIDIVSDGEFSKPTFMGYVIERMTGVESRSMDANWFTSEGEVAASKDFSDFAQFYADAGDQITYYEAGPETEGRAWAESLRTVCTGPVAYTGTAAVARDIANLQAALEGAGVQEGFLPVVAPGSVQPWVHNEHYADEESFFADLATALRVEYTAIVEAGLIVQIDDAFLTHEWDHRLLSGWSVPEYREWATLAVEALNAAIAGLPEDQIRYHLCWGSWNGPHSTDIPFPEIVDLMLKVNAQTYVLEAANARHEWEYQVWQDVKLPEGKILMPGVIEHTTHVVEHPETVADRILRFANLVGRENVIAGTDCGFRGRSHPQIAWAKMQALADGAEIASRKLWGRA